MEEYAHSKQVPKALAGSRNETARKVGELIISEGSRARPSLEEMVNSPSAEDQAWGVYGLLFLRGLNPTQPSGWLSRRTKEGPVWQTGRWTANIIAALVALISIGLAAYIAITAVADPDFFAFIMLAAAIVVSSLVLIAVVLNIAQRIVSERRDNRQAEDIERIQNAVNGDENVTLDHSTTDVLIEYRDRPELIELALRSYPEEDQKKVAGFLGEIGVRRNIERTVAGPGTRSLRVRNIRLLGWFAEDESLPLLTQLTGSPDVGIVFAASSSLSAYDNEFAYKVLFQMLRDERLPRSRVTDFLRFSRYHDKVTIDAQNTETEDDPKIRFRIAFLLGKTDDDRALSALYRLCDDESDEVAANAIEAVGELNDQNAVPIVRRLLTDSSWLTRAHAAKAARMLKNPELIPNVSPLLRDEQWWVRQNAALALKGMGDDAVPELVKFLRDSDRFAGNKAAEILGRLGVIDEQIQNLRNEGEKGDEAHDFLVAAGKAEAESIIENRMLVSNPGLQCRLSEILSEAGRSDAIPFLEQVRDEAESKEVKDAAREAINKIREAA